MARVTKDPEERKKEITMAAYELFATKGFEETAVSDIVKKVGVAQGLFYYYFKSKEQVLEAVLEYYSGELVNKINQIALKTSENALKKIQAIFDAFFDLGEFDDLMVNYAHRPENSEMHQRFMFQTIKKVLPLLTDVVKQGVAEGLLEVSNPEDTTAVLIMGMGAYIHSIEGFFDHQEVFLAKRKVLLEIIATALGVKK